MPAEADRTIAHYHLIEKIGEGGMGVIYRARDTALDRDVAIKILPEDIRQDADRLARFEREAKAVAALSHPNIVAIHGFGSDGETTYAVMELLEGESMRDTLARGRVPPRKAVDYMRQTANGLAAAHDKGVVHRDIKPENLFVTREGRVKILDFGLAKHLHPTLVEEGPGGQPNLTEYTEPGVLMGTVGYMSPEQVRGMPADRTSDIFGLGAVLYELLSGRRAFERDSPLETLTAILREDPPALSGSEVDLPSGLEPIVLHCLEKSPHERFQSAHDLAFNLGILSQTSGLGVVTDEIAGARGYPRRVSLLWAAVFAVGASLLGAVAGGFFSEAPPPELPDFQRLTFRRGLVSSARFTPDGRTFVYGAAWEHRPFEIFVAQAGNPGSRPLGVESADLLSVSSTGELAVSLNRHFTSGWESRGTLARVPLQGGAPREIAGDVYEADWAPDGKSLAVVREVEGRVRLEFPFGKVLYEVDGWISHVRVAPRGDLVAFVDHPVRGDNVGSVEVIDQEGRRTRLLDRGGAHGLAWAPGGGELWACTGRHIEAVTLSGEHRRVHRSAGLVALHDISKDGRVLLAELDGGREIVGQEPGGSEERNLSWFHWSMLRDLSADGRQVLFGEGNFHNADGYWLFLRPTNGSPPVRLGDGQGLGLSPDGRWALSIFRPFSEKRLMLLPTGAGQSRLLPLEGFQPQPWGRWLPGRERFLLLGRRSGESTRIHAYDATTNELRAVTPQGTQYVYPGAAVSPDGAWVAAVGIDGRQALYAVDSEENRPIPGILQGELPVQWSADGRYLFAFRPGELPSPVTRIDLESGAREPWKSLKPRDPAGVFNIDRLFLTRDGKACAYGYRRMLSVLYLTSGLH